MLLVLRYGYACFTLTARPMDAVCVVVSASSEHFANLGGQVGEIDLRSWAIDRI